MSAVNAKTQIINAKKDTRKKSMHNQRNKKWVGQRVKEGGSGCISLYTVPQEVNEIMCILNIWDIHFSTFLTNDTRHGFCKPFKVVNFSKPGMGSSNFRHLYRKSVTIDDTKWYIHIFSFFRRSPISLSWGNVSLTINVKIPQGNVKHQSQLLLCSNFNKIHRKVIQTYQWRRLKITSTLTYVHGALKTVNRTIFHRTTWKICRSQSF